MHSIKSHTVTALPKILAFAKANNYRFVTLSEWKEVMIRVDPIAVRMAAERAERRAGGAPAKLAEVPHGTEPPKANRPKSPSRKTGGATVAEPRIRPQPGRSAGSPACRLR